jgi:flavin-dependent dehydrogenase
MRAAERREVAIVGGGPAGAALAAVLASSGRDVVLLERRRAWRWRACGVFTSPAAIAELGRVGLDRSSIDRICLRIPAMRVEAPGAPPFRLTYRRGDGDTRVSAAGFDREALDEALIGRATTAGVEMRRGADVRSVAGSEVTIRTSEGESRLRARVIVGADGIRSVVARHAGVTRSPRLSRVALTYHVAAPRTILDDARMLIVPGGYCGLAPVPGGRMNVGIVLDGRWRGRLARDGAAAVAASIDPTGATRCDAVVGASPVGHRVARRSGPNWLLVGDAAGFLDPFTGEGLHRALVSARLAGRAIDDLLTGRAADLSAYERQMRGRFRAKDAVSLIVQAFVARPALFAYAARRLAARSRVRETMGAVMGDLVPATRGLDPRYLADLLRP